ncbi:MAG: hypothetical protein QXK47_02405 [Candidatus Bathyarchaeia archaeon]
MNRKEYFKMREVTAKIELFLALRKFCDEIGNACVEHCEDCGVHWKKEKLKEEIKHAYS